MNSSPSSATSDSISEPEILLERQNGVGIITLNRPSGRNPLSLAFSDAMLAVLNEADRDDSLHALVLTGAGPVFCAGAELGAVVHPDGIDSERQFRHLRGFGQVVQRIRDLDLPVIAAVNGPAVGGGAVLAMACDMAVAAEEASYYFAFGRVGAAGCDMGCTYLLPRIVGTVRANHWLFTGATVRAAEGKATGLFVDVVPREKLLDCALRIADQIKSATPRRAAGATKLAVLRGQDADLQTCLSYEAYVQAFMFTKEDHRLRLKALMNRTKPS